MDCNKPSNIKKITGAPPRIHRHTKTHLYIAVASRKGDREGQRGVDVYTEGDGTREGER